MRLPRIPFHHESTGRRPCWVRPGRPLRLLKGSLARAASPLIPEGRGTSYARPESALSNGPLDWTRTSTLVRASAPQTDVSAIPPRADGDQAPAQPRRERMAWEQSEPARPDLRMYWCRPRDSNSDATRTHAPKACVSTIPPDRHSGRFLKRRPLRTLDST